MRLSLAISAAAAALSTGLDSAAAPTGARQAPATPEQARFFETSIRPVLVTRCQQCHGPGEQKAGLRLDTPKGIRKGGARGPIVVSGSPDASRLIAAVRH